MTGFWKTFVSDCSRSVSEMQKLKAEILKHNLFSDPTEREAILLLIDEIIWGEVYAATAGREERQKHRLAITNLNKSIQERAA